MLEEDETGDGGDVGERLFGTGDAVVILDDLTGDEAAASSSSSEVKETKVTEAWLGPDGGVTKRRGLDVGRRRKLRLEKGGGRKGYALGGGSLPSRRASASERFSRR